MDIDQIKLFVEKSSHDIKALRKTITELTTNIHALAEGQKNLSELVHSEMQHSMHVEPLKQTANELNTALAKIHDRIDALEKYQLTTVAANKARFSVIEKIAQYAPLALGALLAFVTVDTVLALKELAA
jgi:predicted RNase H-like nuclease (RuvC/YqgF family)